MTRPESGAESRRRFSNAAVNLNTDDYQQYSDPPVNTELRTLTVQWDKSMGIVNGTGNFIGNAGFGQATAAPGDTITLTAYPEKGYHFVKWAGGVSTSKNTNNPISIKMNTSVEVTAVFAKDIDDGGTPPPGENPPGGPLGDDEGQGGNSGNGGQDYYPDAPLNKVKSFVKQWWWAILIVGYIVYKEMKGAKQ